MIMMTIKIFMIMALFIAGLTVLIMFIEKCIDAACSTKGSKITDYGCREDFSQRFEDDPWSMFRG